MKNVIRSLCPPILWQAAQRIIREGTSSNPTFSGHYDSFEAAAHFTDADFGVLKDQGGRDGAIQAGEQEMALALAYVSPQKVIDVGGAFGVHFRTHQKLGLPIPSEWVIIEHPDVVAQAQATAPIRYSSDIAAIDDGCDLVILSVVLQSLSDPFGTLSRVAASNPKYIFIQRTPLGNVETPIVAIHHVQGAHYVDGRSRSCPYWLFSDRDFAVRLGQDFATVWEAQGNTANFTLDGSPLLATYCSRLLRPKKRG